MTGSMNPERDADIVRLLLAGVPRKEVAAKYHITPERVAQIGDVRGGIARAYDTDNETDDFEWTEETEAELRRRWLAGEKTPAIGRALGCSKNAVCGKVDRMGLPQRYTSKGQRPVVEKKSRVAKKPSRRKPTPEIFGLDPAVKRAAERLRKRLEDVG